MEIRLLEAADAASYWEVRLEALKQNPEAFLTSYEEAVKRENPIEQTVNMINTDGNFIFGAFDKGQLVGVVTLMQEKAQKVQHRANIFAMYVKPIAQGKGVGKALLTTAINFVRTIKEIEKVNLSVVSSNEKAKGLYKRVGFNVFGVEERAMKIDNTYYDEVHMVLFL